MLTFVDECLWGQTSDSDDGQGSADVLDLGDCIGNRVMVTDVGTQVESETWGVGGPYGVEGTSEAGDAWGSTWADMAYGGSLAGNGVVSHRHSRFAESVEGEGVGLTVPRQLFC